MLTVLAKLYASVFNKITPVQQSTEIHALVKETHAASPLLEPLSTTSPTAKGAWMRLNKQFLEEL